jgi:hypothetical protein
LIVSVSWSYSYLFWLNRGISTMTLTVSINQLLHEMRTVSTIVVSALQGKLGPPRS